MTKPEGWNMTLKEWVKTWTITEMEAFAKYLSFRVLTDDQKQEVVDEVMKEYECRLDEKGAPQVG